MTRLGRALAGCLLALAALITPPGYAAATTATTAAALPARVGVTTLDPRAPAPGDRLVVRGTVRNDGPGRLRDLTVRLRISLDPLRTRSELAERAEDVGPVGFPLSDPGASAGVPDLPPGGSAPYAVAVDVDQLPLRRLGVYPLGIEVRGSDATGSRVLGRTTTWLPWSAGQIGPTRLGWLWPLVDVPDRRADGTFPDDRLAAELAPGGRLADLVAAARAARVAASGRRVPVTWAVDPALLEAVDAMTAGYRVRVHAGTRPGRGSAAAGAFLAALRPQAAVDPVLALPYGDPDLVALVRAGRTGDVTVASAAPTFPQLVESVLRVAPIAGYGWPPDGYALRSTLDALPGIDTVVLSGDALPPHPSLTYTPSAAATLPAVGGGRLRALVTDPTLDRIVARGPSDTGGVRLAEQRFLAETLLISAERPGGQRTLVIAPPRRWAPPPGWAAALLHDTGAVPWLAPTTLPRVPPPSPPDAREPLAYPRAERAQELPRSVFRGPGSVGDIAGQLEAFRGILTDPEGSGVPALQRALLRCESAAWRGNLNGERRLRGDVARTLARLRDKVAITSSGSVSLASTSSTIGVSIANSLDQSVQVQLELTSNGARLTAERVGVQRIAAGHQIQVDVKVHAATGGVFPVYAALRTPSGAPYGRPVKLLVHSSSYGTAAIGITVGAALVLAGAAAVRLTRRVLAARPHRPRPAS